MDEIAALLAAYGELLEVGPLALGPDGTTVLAFGDGLEVSIGAAEGGSALILAMALGSLPAERSPDLLVELLDANYLWQGTAGATLGVSADTGLLALCRHLGVAGLDAEGLETVIDAMVECAEDWQERLQS